MNAQKKYILQHVSSCEGCVALSVLTDKYLNELCITDKNIRLFLDVCENGLGCMLGYRQKWISKYIAIPAEPCLFTTDTHSLLRYMGKYD